MNGASAINFGFILVNTLFFMLNLHNGNPGMALFNGIIAGICLSCGLMNLNLKRR